MQQELKIFFLESCGSTMDVAKDYARRPELHNSPFLVVTHHQTKGRGRFYRTWVQSYADTKYTKDFLPFTYALPINELRISLEQVPLVTGKALYKAFLTLYRLLQKRFPKIKFISKKEWHLEVKWPNDLVWIQKNSYEKMAGILCEAQSRGGAISSQGGISHVYIGIGINFFSHPKLSGSCSFFEKIIPHFTPNTFTPNECEVIVNEFWKIILAYLKKYLSIRGGIFLNSQNVVCFDFGNTRIHITAKNFQNITIHEHISYETLKKGLRKKLHKILKIFNHETIKNILFCFVTVNSKKITNESLQKIKKEFQKFLPRKKIIKREITEKIIFQNLPLHKNLDFKTLGSDRALKCLFAIEESKRLQKNVLIFSFGTAMTCEGFSKDGKMIENFVFPGLQMSFLALHEYTALLPLLDGQKVNFVKSPSYWTQKIYMQRGVILSVLSSILTISKFHAPCKVFLTGGNSIEMKRFLFELEDENLLNSYEIEVIENLETKMLLRFCDFI